MDVKSACAEGVLDYQDVGICADGKLKLTTAGLHFFPKLEDETSEDDGVEVLCAMFLREGERKIWRSSLVSALHLDNP